MLNKANALLPLVRCLSRRAVPLVLMLLPAAVMANDEAPHGRYTLPDTGDMVGEAYKVDVREGQTLLDIAHEHNVGYEEIRHSNPDTSIWAPDAGDEVVIPARYILPPVRREGIVINLAELRLYYYPDTAKDEPPRVETYPIGIGRDGYDTPLGVTETTTKVRNPAWYPPESIRQEAAENGETLPPKVPAGEDNPLGSRAILLDLPGYLIHGTNRPDGVGMRVSHGCVRMMPETIEALFPRIKVGERVNIIDMPVKVGRENGQRYVQSFPRDDQQIEMGDLLHALEEIDEADDKPVDYAQLRQALENSGWQPTVLAPVDETPDEAEPQQWYDRVAGIGDAS